MLKVIKDSLKDRLSYLVVGDVMLDKYILGSVNRISPEAPVPVLNVKEHKDNPGGAGNVAINIAGLNGKVDILGFTGDDESLNQLNSCFNRLSINLEPVIWDRGTITKTRLISGQQQIVRIDYEESIEPTKEDRSSLIKGLKKKDIGLYNGIIISDYAKGVCSKELCQRIIKEAISKSIPVIVDPKGSSWEKYRGATILTPNLKELGDIYGESIENCDEKIELVGLELLNRYNFDNLIITRSEKGMTLVNKKTVQHFPTMAKDVFDVSGAGDTVVAGVIRFLTSGLNITDSIDIANFCAGIVVGHVGTWPITKDELLKEAESHHYLQKKVVFTNGCFDLLHPGHIDYLRKARALGDKLIVGLNSDESVKRLKGEARPVNNQETRKIMLEALEFVDEVIIFTEDTPYNLIKRISPDILVKGGDYEVDSIVGREFARETKTIPFLDGFSTTSLIDRIKSVYE